MNLRVARRRSIRVSGAAKQGSRLDQVMCLLSFTSFFFSFLKITQIGKFASSVGPGEEINQLLKELPWGQGGLSLPRSQLCTTLRMLIRLISAEEHLGTAAATAFGTQPWVSPGEGSFPNQRFFLLSFIRWLS